MLRETALLFLALISLLLLTHSGFDYSEVVYHYAIAEQIVQHGELSFREHREGTYYVAPNGRTYATHEFGNTLILLPVAVVNHLVESKLGPRLGASRIEMITRFLLAAMGPLVCAAGGVFLYLILRLVFLQTVGTATMGVLISVFCSFYWSYSRIMFDGVLCAVLLTAATLFLFRFARNPERESLLIAAFGFLGFGLITRISMVLPVAAAAVYCLLIRDRAGRLVRWAALVAITLAPFVCWQLYYNHLRTGNPLLSPVQMPLYASANGLDGNLLRGLAGLLASPGKSIFVYCPIAALSLVLMARFWRAHRDEAVFVSIVALAWLLLHAKMRSWYGNWGWGPRYFVTVVPVLALPFLAMRLGLHSRLWRVMSAGLLCWGFVLAAASNLTNVHYRQGVANQSGLLNNETFYWSIGRNQALDALVTCLHNFTRMIRGGAYDVLPGASARDVFASNTVNLWPVTAHYLGVPLAAICIAVLALSCCAIVCLGLLLRQAGAVTSANRRSTAGAVR